MDTRRSTQRVALGITLLGIVAFVAIAAQRVPWEPVPGGMPAPVSASSVFSSADIERAEHYARWARTWSWSSLAVSIAVACWLGFGRRGRAWAERVPGWWWVRIVVVVAALALVGRAVTLPFGIALRRLSLDEGLAAGSWADWASDIAKGEAIAV